MSELASRGGGACSGAARTGQNRERLKSGVTPDAAITSNASLAAVLAMMAAHVSIGEPERAKPVEPTEDEKEAVARCRKAYPRTRG